ncbi:MULTISPECIES: hypothetical protein [unclassified Pannonibacter]|uniref:hypothetical protein n=1 Tax=unclassified Pannonibacter TaxID=2627228 RepID=UPI001644708A|nr:MULTISPECIES: hypothetical protein [unclassified Pannonibacter]
MVVFECLAQVWTILAREVGAGVIAALAVYTVTFLVMRGTLASGFGLMQLFCDQRAHEEAIRRRGFWRLYLSPAFTATLLLFIWIGVALYLTRILPVALERDVGTSVRAALHAGQMPYGVLIWLVSGTIAAVWARPPDTPWQPGEPFRRFAGAAIGFAVTLAVLYLYLPALDPLFASREAGPQLALAVLVLVAFVGAESLRLQTCAAWFLLLLLVTALVALASAFDALVLTLGLAAGIGVLAWRMPVFRLRIPGLDYSGELPDPSNPGQDGSVWADRPEPPALLAPEAVLAAWAARLGAENPASQDGDAGQKTDDPEPLKPKLVLLATSGGAYRAGFWTAAVLDGLSRHDPLFPGAAAEAGKGQGTQSNVQLPGFMNAIRFITGASGGMVAGAYLTEQTSKAAQGLPVRPVARMIEDDIAAWQQQQPPQAPPGMRYPAREGVIVPRDSISPVARQMVRDVGAGLLPRVRRADRGRVLEAQWGTLRLPFNGWREEERQGLRPSVVFSPMLVETGAPLFISNLDLLEMRKHFAAEDPDVHSAEMFRVYPYAQVGGSGEEGHAVRTGKRGKDEFTVATAVRLSATFPYVSPAVSLPAMPQRRVVDAGYYDNYGVMAATGLINARAVRNWVVRNTSGVLIVNVRAFPDQDRAKPASALARLFWWLTSPLEGVFNARGSSQTIRNRDMLRMTRDLYGLALQEANPGVTPPKPWREIGQDFVTIANFTFDDPTTMSWFLIDSDYTRLQAEAERDTAATNPTVQRIAEFWQRNPLAFLKGE